MPNINDFSPRSGRVIKDDGTIVNEANGIQPDGSRLVKFTGSFIRLAAEPKPTMGDGAQDGDDLLLVDSKEVYIFYKGVWYLQ